MKKSVNKTEEKFCAFLPKCESGKGEKMSGKSPRPDFGWTDYRFKINDNFGMLHETTLKIRIKLIEYVWI